jgi:hypothetical protein
MKLPSFISSLFLIPLLLAAQPEATKVYGTLRDCEDGSPVYYANIGIIGLGIGTVSSMDGDFFLNIANEHLDCILTISRIGYETISYNLKEYTPETGITISMKPVEIQLSEVNVTATKLKSKIKGYKTNSRTMVAALDSKSRGAETGTILTLPKRDGVLKDINFNIVTNNPDSAVFRLNIYSFEDARPGKNLLRDNIFFPLYRGQTGNYSIDLSDYEIVVNDDIFISLELLDIFSHEGSDHLSEMASERINISVALGKGYYNRKTSFGDWELKNNRFSPGFWVTVLY